MKVVDLMGLRPSEGADDVLPLYYDVDIIARYWKRRPVAAGAYTRPLFGAT
jgi:hypothetical protein